MKQVNNLCPTSWRELSAIYVVMAFLVCAGTPFVYRVLLVTEGFSARFLQGI
jgi:hypothetical protein